MRGPYWAPADAGNGSADATGGGSGATGAAGDATAQPGTAGNLPAEGAPADKGNGATPPAKSPPAAKGTIADGHSELPEGKAPPVNFPDTWRELLAGQDQGLLNILQRYRSPSAFGKAHGELHQRLRAGGALKEAPGENATPEEVTAWRQQQGIPDKAEGYFEKLPVPDGMVLSDTDKAIAGTFFEHAHKLGWSSAQAHQAMAWYFDHATRTQVAQADGDENDRANTIRDLKVELGPAEYQRSIAALQSIGEGNQEIRDAMTLIWGSRGPDGTLLGNNPAILRAMTALALEINPAARIMPSDRATSRTTVDKRIVEIEQVISSDNADAGYWNNPAVRKEYRELLETRERLDRRNAGGS